MFKSCNYCRHRKKKCVVIDASTRCSDCEHLDLPCEFSRRLPSLKRRKTSRQVAARVGIVATSKSPKSADYGGGRVDNGVDEANLKEGDCQLRLAGRRDMANKRLIRPSDAFQDEEGVHISLSERYWRDIHPFWPFVSPKMEESMDDSNFWRFIDLACRLSPKSLGELGDSSLYAGEFVMALQRDQLSTSATAAALILCSFLYIEDSVVQKIFDTVENQVGNSTGPVLLPVLSGALLTNVWRRLAGHSHPPLRLPTKILQSYARTLDTETFGHHYARLSHLAAEFDQLRTELATDGIKPHTPQVWARLEHECLLWQVCLPSALLDARDELPSTPESVIIHSFSSLLLLSLYGYILERADTLGVLLALRPVPGVLLFLCTLARSTFICPCELLDRMALLVSIQAQTVQIMLRLWRRTGFENCRGILNLWENPGGRFPELASRVREEIGRGPWSVEEIDGYSVFWTFRDLRTLTTEFIFTESSISQHLPV